MNGAYAPGMKAGAPFRLSFEGSANFPQGEQTARLIGEFKLKVGKQDFPHKKLVFSDGMAHFAQKPSPPDTAIVNKIFVKFTGTGVAQSAEAATFEWKGVVTHGTGAYAHAKGGKFTATGSFGPNLPGDISLSYVVNV